MMNSDQENQPVQPTSDAAAQDHASEQRRILEERLAEINARSGSNETTAEADAGVETPVVEEVPSAEAAFEAEQELTATAAPVVEPEQTQSSVLTSEENVVAAAAAPEVAQTEDVLSEEPVATTPQEEEAPAPIATAPDVPMSATAPAIPSVTEIEGAGHEEEEMATAQEDLSSASIEDIRKRLLTLTQDAQARKSSRVVMDVYRQYELKFQEERQEALRKFVAEGSSEDDFEYHPPREHQEVEQAMQRFREARFREQRQEEEQKVQNLQRKRELLVKLREFVESSETNDSGNAMKQLQAEWKAIGQVPTADAQELWNSYHALLDMYYNNRSIFFELKELDRKRNLDAKMLLVERAEALAGEENINKSLQELRHLHDEWKHIGPVPNESRDLIWDRFIQASEKVHEKKKTFMDNRKAEETLNLEVKRALLAEIDQFQHFQSDRINDWRDKTDQIQKLKERWDVAGLVPKENAEEVNKAFWSSYKAFFHHKNTFFKALDEEKMQNYRAKVALCEEAESAQASTDWDSTKEKMIQLQKKWKTIGRVPDKYSDKIWNRFRTACNAFFDRMHDEAKNRETEVNKLSAQKQAYCEQLATKVADPTFVGSTAEFEQMRQEWNTLGAEGGKRNGKLEDRFQQLLSKYLDKVPEMSSDQREQTLFQMELQSLKTSPDADQKLYQKEQYLRREVQTIENDISTLKTNIEFFARSKNAEKLREEYQARIDEAQGRMQHLKRQLKALRS